MVSRASGSDRLTVGDDRDLAARRAGIVSALLRLGRAIDGLLRDGAGPLRLTPAQAEALRFAGRIRPDMATVGQLARVLGVRHATAVGILGPLIDRGLIERRPHPFDGRQRVLALTPEGARLLGRLTSLTVSLETTLDELEPRTLAQLELGLGALVAGLQRSGALVVAAPCAGCVHFQPDADPGSPRPHRCALLQRFLADAEARMDCPEHVAGTVPA